MIVYYKQGARFARPLLHLFCIYMTSCSYTHCMQYHVSTAVTGQTLLLKRGHSLIKESSRACGALIILCSSTRMMLYIHSIVAHAHLLHPVQARDLINHLAKKLVSSLAVSPATCEKLRSKEKNLLPK